MADDAVHRLTAVIGAGLATAAAPRTRGAPSLVLERDTLVDTYDSLVQANGGSTDVSSWKSTPDTKAAGQTMPQYDAIGFRSIGIVGQPGIDWQNRPTFQQVVEFPRHR